MNPHSFGLSARILAALFAASLLVPAHAQAPAQKPIQANPDEAWLASAGKLYYSTAKEGLRDFDCNVRPDWHGLFASAAKDAPGSQEDARIVLLKSVKVAIHARLKGGSTIEWVQPSSQDKPLDADSVKLLSDMHGATEQTLQGFLQFWIPFVDGSVVPDSAAGLEIKHTPTGHSIHADQGGTAVTELFDNNLLLQNFDVNMSGTSVKFSPTYKPTQKGLLVSGFLAHILPAGAPPEQTQEMHVTIDYQNVNGFNLPSKLGMEVVGTGIFNFTFDGCTTNQQPK